MIVDVISSLLSSPVLIIAGVIILLVVATRLGWVEIKLPFFTASRSLTAKDADTRIRAARLDLAQYGEVATALAWVVDADPDEAERAAREWFSQLATRLALRLKEEKDHHYRVAIWLDDPQYPDRFIGIGRGMFHHNDVDMDSLERKHTIGGLAFESVTMSYYCSDVQRDQSFKPRKHVPPSFKSVFGLALGTTNDRWGVMTVDARQLDGFPEDTQWLIRQFGELASLGAVIWYSRVAPTGPVEGTTG